MSDSVCAPRLRGHIICKCSVADARGTIRVDGTGETIFAEVGAGYGGDGGAKGVASHH